MLCGGGTAHGAWWKQECLGDTAQTVSQRLSCPMLPGMTSPDIAHRLETGSILLTLCIATFSLVSMTLAYAVTGTKPY